MVIVSNNPIDANTIYNEYPPDSIERKILDILISSRENYRYSTLEELNFELMLRKEIIQSAIDLHNSGLGFEVFRDVRANTDYWEVTREGGIRLKSGVKPSDAIRDIYINGSKYGTECATAMVIVYYKTLANIFPEELFNRTFPKIELMNWRYIDRDLTGIGIPKKVKDFLPADRRYFANPDVDPLTPQWQGENAIDLGNGLYYGHGIGIHKADTIINALNQNRREGSQRSAYLLDTAARPDFKWLSKIYYSFIQ